MEKYIKFLTSAAAITTVTAKNLNNSVATGNNGIATPKVLAHICKTRKVKVNVNVPF